MSKPITKYKNWNRVFEGSIPDVYYFDIKYSDKEGDSSIRETIIHLIKTKLESYSGDVNIDSVKMEGTGDTLQITFSMKESEFDLYSNLGIVEPETLDIQLGNRITNGSLVDIIKQHSNDSIKLIERAANDNESLAWTQRAIFNVKPAAYKGGAVSTLLAATDFSKASLDIIQKPRDNYAYKSVAFSIDKLDSLFTSNSEKDKILSELRYDLVYTINTDPNFVKEFIRIALEKMDITIIPKNLKEFTTRITTTFNEIEDGLANAKSTEEKEEAIVNALNVEIELGKTMRDGYLEQETSSNYIMELYALLTKHNVSNDDAERLIKKSKYYKGN